MSEQINIIAIAQPATGKADRFKQVTAEAIKWIEANEPDTLEFTMYEERSEDGVKISLFERYASEAALAKHEGSENYKEFFQKVMEEGLLAGPPLITRTKRSEGFRR